MNLNLLDITIIVILAFYLISGMYRGFITSMLGTLGFIGAWFGAQQLYPQVANLALSNQSLMAVLNQYLEPESFFASHAQAVTTVSEVIAGGETAIQNAVAPIAQKGGRGQSARPAGWNAGGRNGKPPRSPRGRYGPCR